MPLATPHLRNSRRAGATFLALILLIAALPRAWAAISDQGIFWPDEIYQSLEPAHRFAFGYGLVSWEFQEGARSWLFPGALGLFWRLLAALGVDGAPALVVSAKLLMAALALVGVGATMRIAGILAGAEAAVLAGGLAALFPPSIVYGSRCMSEMASGPVLAVAAMLALGSGRRRLALAGGLAGLAVFLRLQNGLVTLGLLVWLLAKRRRGEALAYVAGTAAALLAGGVLDALTWGSPFHSLVTYVRFNLIEGRSAEFGVEPVEYYFAVLGSATGVSVLALAIGLVESARRAAGLLAVVLLYLLAHSLVAHKEFRFIMPIVPLLLALGGAGLAVFVARFRSRPALGATVGKQHPGRTGARHATRRAPIEKPAAALPASPVVRPAVWAVAILLAAAMGWQAARASFADFGQRRSPLAGTSPLWHRREPINRLLWLAGRQPDLCGLALVGYARIWTGGYTYLHRDVPLLSAASGGTGSPPELAAALASANYVLAPADTRLPGEYETLRTIGDAKLARRSGSCAPPPGSYTRMFPK